ncbi:hypothetical protein GDO81_002598 [Engystomops pustulosus]|uniref:Uncharacterized protein n=1 Tax=Engystomops pustulosus TaxID=76066 RepID=A0AAV7DMJ5_ENGPU|nr:hypothetical protein GDO81_002598 [Engystomops pustulosus]
MSILGLVAFMGLKQIIAWIWTQRVTGEWHRCLGYGGGLLLGRAVSGVCLVMGEQRHLLDIVRKVWIECECRCTEYSWLLSEM